MTASEFRKLIEEKGKIEAVRTFVTVQDEQGADAFIFQYVMKLLANGHYGAAAMVLWGPDVFDARPKSVKRIWRGIIETAKRMIMGAGSVGKSFTGIVWLLEDWWRDPEWTSIKIVSTTSKHARSNTFSTLKHLHESAVIRMPGIVTDGFIRLRPNDNRAAIELIAIPAGSDGKGRLQGFHPIPRPTPHPIFGRQSRVRVFLDEAEEIPLGVWEGVANMAGNLHGAETVKIICAFNPKDVSTKVAQLCCPEGGYDAHSPDELKEWTSKEGWPVTRIDGRDLENVIERRMVYHGFQTYEGYREKELENGGNSPSYWAFGRGYYAPDGVSNNIISSQHLSGCRGEFIFISSVVKCAGVDIAVDGRDRAVMTTGRYGLARAFIHHRVMESGGIKQVIREEIAFSEPRQVLQIDQQFEIRKGSTSIVAHEIRDHCKRLGIAPEWCCVDRTGNGATIHDLLCEPEVWGIGVQGCDFSKGATDIKILREDKETPEEMYSGVVTEVWFALRKWMEFGYIAISPSVRADPLNQELLGRKYLCGEGKKLRVEKKDDYVGRLGASPDWGDSLTLILFGVRMRSGIVSSMTGKRERERDRSVVHGVIDTAQGAYMNEDSV